MGIKEDMIIFGGKSTKDFNLYVSGFDTYNTPKRDIEAVTVPGRNGDIMIDNGRYENVDITYKCLMLKQFKTEFSAFVAYLMANEGYQRLEDTFHPDEFRLAIVQKVVKPKLYDYDNANFSLTFNCKPQRYLKSGEEIITLNDGGTIYNETVYTAKPLIRAYSAGTLTVNGKNFIISSVSEYVDIDCDLMTAYKGSTNKNNTVSGVFPELIPGTNTITYTGKLEIMPRWWRL